MKHIIIICLLSGFHSGFSQQDPQLGKRLKALMQATQALDFEKVLIYTYPKVFTIVPKEKMLETLKSSLETDEITMRFDSLKVDSLYPVFVLANARYAKISYSMKMIMKLKYSKEDSTVEAKKELSDEMLKSVKIQFSAEKVTADSTGDIGINMHTLLIAVKDHYAREWCFVNWEDKNPLMGMLFSKTIINKIRNYK